GGHGTERDGEQRRLAEPAGEAGAGALRPAPQLGADPLRRRGRPSVAGAAPHRAPPRASQRRAPPRRANSTPTTTPTASAPPPRASAATTIATPRTSSSALSVRVDAR